MTSSTSDIASAIKDRARQLGFDAVGLTKPDKLGPAAKHLADFIDQGWHGDMTWLANRADQRADPRALWPDVRTVLAVGMSYGPENDPLALLDRPDTGAISVYARSRDYHDVLKKRLKELGRWIAQEYGTALKVFVDTAPVMEKPLAQAAGLGWQGKHSNLVSRDHGSWLFLGAVYLALDLPADPPHPDHCGSCRACLDICPTDAFPAPYQLDARRCLAYLSIEHKGPIPREFRKPMGNRIFGCDDCLAVCPWNKFAGAAKEAKLKAKDALKAPALKDLVELDDTAFRALFAGTPVKRTGRDRFVRNVLIAIGNSGDAGYVPAVERRLADPSPLVRGAAIWALAQLVGPGTVRVLAERWREKETDASVLAEWDAA